MSPIKTKNISKVKVPFFAPFWRWEKVIEKKYGKKYTIIGMDIQNKEVTIEKVRR